MGRSDSKVTISACILNCKAWLHYSAVLSKSMFIYVEGALTRLNCVSGWEQKRCSTGRRGFERMYSMKLESKSAAEHLRPLRMGMVGGGPGAFIGPVHTRAA